MLLLFGLTLFLSGALLFLVEPMFAKMALPKLGGTPAVWNVCMVFYQAVLLAGYAYAHELPKRFAPRRATLIQMAILLAALFALPIHVPQMLSAPVNENPTVRLLMLLAAGVGLPFLVLSTYSSTLQTWYASTSGVASNDPYVLYSAGNLGSMLSLLAYPLVIEPHWGLTQQSRLWSWGFVTLVVFTASCALSLWIISDAKANEGRKVQEVEPRPTRLQELKWSALAFIPSSMMLAITSTLTSELPPIPLLWVLPLSIYLLSFILVFAKKPHAYHGVVVETLPILLLIAAFPIASNSHSPIFLILLYLVTLFFICMACHGELAMNRPTTRNLTRFYLCVSIGGVLGGFFNAIVAPAVFNSLAEVPITLFLAALAMGGIGSRPRIRSINSWDVILPVSLGVGVAGVAFWISSRALSANPLIGFLVLAGPLVVCYTFSSRPLRFALGLGAVLLASGIYSSQSNRTLLSKRSFFGVYRVLESGGYRRLIHGNTVHGIQSEDPARAREPLSYYSETGPIGQVFRSSSINTRLHEVAVVGLGAGSLACYSEPWRQFTFYEIDPMVESIARDPRYFTYLRDCLPGAKIVIGDARLSLENAPARSYDLIVVDAFSSDTVPVHLVTREAIRLYLDKLADHGILAFNVSNRYVDLKPILGELARDGGLESMFQEDLKVDASEQSRGKLSSSWVLIARRRYDFGSLATETNWHAIQLTSSSRVWTDDYSSIVNILVWN